MLVILDVMLPGLDGFAGVETHSPEIAGAGVDAHGRGERPTGL